MTTREDFEVMIYGLLLNEYDTPMIMQWLDEYALDREKEGYLRGRMDQFVSPQDYSDMVEGNADYE